MDNVLALRQFQMLQFWMKVGNLILEVGMQFTLRSNGELKHETKQSISTIGAINHQRRDLRLRS